MPETAATVDAVRAAFCATPAESAALDAIIQAGMRGERNCFYAVEGGQKVGTEFACKAMFVRWVWPRSGPAKS